MANLLLTQRCVRSCPYCFAKRHMSDAPPEDVLSWENLVYLADLHVSSDERHVSLLGGEPTLHPSFVDMVLYLLERDLRVTVFTSGILSEGLLERARTHLANVPPECLGWVCNLNEPRFSPPGEVARVERFLEAFGPSVTPGFNIYHLDFDLAFLAEATSRFGLSGGLRLGLAHPIPGTPNQYIRPEDMAEVARRLMAQAPLLDRLRMSLGPDCGFPLCAFTDEDLGRLYRMNRGHVVFGCGPALDIGPDMAVWSCFPLSDHHRRSVFEFDSLQAIRTFYEERHRTVRTEVGGLVPACDDCRHREDGLCAGGCTAHALAAFRGEAKVRLPEIYP